MTEWPPDYKKIYIQRVNRHRNTLAKKLQPNAFHYYSTHPVEFIEHWCSTYDPRKVGSGTPPNMPFIPFPKQRELIMWFYSLVNDQENGLIEKSRDMGATWCACAFSVWLWVFHPGSSVGWGSRKEMLVDRAGDPDSIFEKIRMLIRGLPGFLRPEGLNEKTHLSFLKCINPANGATITGEAGDMIGRGGRKLMYFKDEAQPLYSKVMTPSGSCLMGDIQLGAEILGPLGDTRRVTHINDCGTHDIYRVRFSDGMFADSSTNHLWTLDRVLGKKERVTLRTCELAERYVYYAPSGQTQYRFRGVPRAPVEFERQKASLPLDSYIVGALIGDGGVSQVPNYCPVLTSKDEDIVELFRNRLPNGCKMSKGANYAWRIVDERGRQGYKVKSRARQAVVAAGIAGCLAHNKYIPEPYLLASYRERLELLRGLMDTDGSGSGGVASFHTCSAQLSDDVLFLVQSLGGTATHNLKPDKRGYRPMHVIHLILPDSVKPFHLDRKNKALRKRSHPIERRIVSVEKIGRAPVRCITVDAADGLYLTDNFIVTHNSAHYERAERIEASLADNTNVQVDISSVNGAGNIFYRKRHSGQTRVFVMDWRDHPDKNQPWYDKRKRKAESEGTEHLFAQEVDRDYTAAVEGIFIPSKYVNAAIDAHIKLGFEGFGTKKSGLDVADDGGDANVQIDVYGPLVTYIDMWKKGDTGFTAKKAYNHCVDNGIGELVYDSVGVGAGVKAKTNELLAESLLRAQEEEDYNEDDYEEPLIVIPFNAGAGVVGPKRKYTAGKKNVDMFYNHIAQGMWHLRTRFVKTYNMVNGIDTYDHSELISLPSNLPHINSLKIEISTPLRETDDAGRVRRETKKAMKKRGMPSPNYLEALVECYTPLHRQRIPEVHLV